MMDKNKNDIYAACGEGFVPVLEFGQVLLYQSHINAEAKAGGLRTRFNARFEVVPYGAFFLITTEAGVFFGNSEGKINTGKIEKED
jgi:hypothetical protein